MDFVFCVWFVAGLAWAFGLYCCLRGETNVGELPLQFHHLANEHKQWAQLWFTISVCIFLGALIVIFTKVMWRFIGPEDDNTYRSLLGSLFSDFFILSIFFVAWNWSVRHFRAHWHNFILNAYRHRALSVLEDMESFGEPDRTDLRKFTALLLLITGDTAYLENDEGKTLAEKIVKVEDLLRETISGAKQK